MIQGIGEKSVNSFMPSDISATSMLAKRYWGEMGTKSPFFRAWFGDWRVNDTTPLHVAQQSGVTKNQPLHNRDTNWIINISGKIFDENKVHKTVANREATLYMPYLDSIVQNAILLDTWGADPKSPNTLLMHSMYAVADIGNGQEVLKLYVEEMNNPAGSKTGKRAYNLQNIEKAFATRKRVQGIPSSSSANVPNAIHTVADLFAAVKAYDSNFNPKPVSCVINPDGTPRVMYHGTSSYGFTIFDTYGGKFGLFGKGSYFTDNPDVAKSYTQKGKGNSEGVYAVYLNIRNPLDMDAKADLSKWRKVFNDMDLDSSYLDGVQTNEDDFKALKEYLQDYEYSRWEAEDLVTDLIQSGMGYDGITHIGGGRYNKKDDTRHRVYIAFEAEQIKSATDNIGTFDGSNPDINFSIRKGEAISYTPRSLLVNADESIANDSAQKEILKKYRDVAGQLQAEEKRLEDAEQQLIPIQDSKKNGA